MSEDRPQGGVGMPGAAPVSAAAGAPPPRPSALTDSAAGRLLGVLVAPGKTFDSIVRRPTWVLALVLVTVLSLITSLVVVQHMDLASSVRERIEKSGGSLSPEQVDQQVAMAEKVSKIAIPLAALVFVPLMYLAVALVFWLLMRLVGGEFRYPVSLAVSLHGMLPQTLAGLLSLPLILSHGLYSPDAIKRGVLASNLAFLAPEGASPAAVALLGSVDLFTLWSLALLIIGYRRAGRTSAGATAGVVIGVWLLYVLAKVGLAAAGIGR